MFVLHFLLLNAETAEDAKTRAVKIVDDECGDENTYAEPVGHFSEVDKNDPGISGIKTIKHVNMTIRELIAEFEKDDKVSDPLKMIASGDVSGLTESDFREAKERLRIAKGVSDMLRDYPELEKDPTLFHAFQQEFCPYDFTEIGVTHQLDKPDQPSYLVVLRVHR